MSTRRKLTYGILTVYVLGMIVIVAAFGAKRQDNDLFKPQNEFKLLTWFSVGPIDFNKGVLYLLLATGLTLLIMTYVEIGRASCRERV